MECYSKFLCLLIVLWSSSLAVYGQDCSELQASDLGNTDAQSSDGLLARTLVSLGTGEGTPISVQILELNTVCLSQGVLEDTYTRTSVVVSYTADGVETLSQVEYRCTDGVWEFPGTGSPTIDNSPTADLTTPVRVDCILCFDPSSAPPSATVTEVEHCIACNTTCVDGLMRCTGTFSSQTCCSYFDMTGSCVAACPANSSPDSDFDCACDPGYATAATGNSCEEINECDPDPCENGGTCTDLVNAYSCVCIPGYTDNNCTTIIDECDPDPCENGGTCTSTVNGNYSCNCFDGFTGATCSTVCDIEDCILCSEDNVCETCDDGYNTNEDGTLCEIEIPPNNTNNTPIIVGVVVALLVLLLMVGAVVTIVILVVKKQWTGSN